jgi:hypothetical protein
VSRHLSSRHGFQVTDPMSAYFRRLSSLFNAGQDFGQYAIPERLGAGPELLAIVGRWGDTLADVDVLHHCTTSP